MFYFSFFFFLDTSEGNVLYLFSYIDFEAVFNTLRRKYMPFTLFWKGCVFSSRTNQKFCLGIQRLDFKYYEFFRLKSESHWHYFDLCVLYCLTTGRILVRYCPMTHCYLPLWVNILMLSSLFTQVC